MSLAEVVQHYLQCKRAAPADITACVLVPEFMLDGLRPLLTGKTLFKKYKKKTVLFDAPTSNRTTHLARRTLAGVRI